MSASKPEVLSAMMEATAAAMSKDHPRASDVFRAALRAAAELGWEMKPANADAEMWAAFVEGEWFQQKPRPDEIWSEMFTAAPNLLAHE